MIDFKVISSNWPDKFESTIADLLNEGWKLHGSPFISSTGGMTQALTKETKKMKTKGAAK